MARMNWITDETPKLKRTNPPGKKWKRLFLISFIVNIILALTTIYVVLH